MLSYTFINSHSQVSDRGASGVVQYFGFISEAKKVPEKEKETVILQNQLGMAVQVRESGYCLFVVLGSPGINFLIS